MKKFIPICYIFILSLQLSCQQKTVETKKNETLNLLDSISTDSTQAVEVRPNIEKTKVLGSSEWDYYFYNWPDSFLIRSNGRTDSEYQNFRISTSTRTIATVEFRPWAHAFGLAIGETGYKIAGFDASREKLKDGRIQYCFESLSAEPGLSSNIYTVKISPDYEKWFAESFSVKMPVAGHEFVNFPNTIFPLSFPSKENIVGVTFKFITREKDGILYTDVILQLSNFDYITRNECKVASIVGKPEITSKFQENFQEGDTITLQYWYAGQGGTFNLRHQGVQLVFEQLLEEELDMETAEKIERGEITYQEPKAEILHSWTIPENTNLSFRRYIPMGDGE